MSRGSSPLGSGLPEEKEEEDPPRISNKKNIVIVDLIELVKDQKTRKGLNYVIQAVEQIKKDRPFKAENLDLDRAIVEAKRKFPENSKKVPWESPLSDVIMYLNRKEETFSHIIENASVGVLIGLILYYIQLNLIKNVNNDEYDDVEEFMDQIKEQLEKKKDLTNTELYSHGITPKLLDIFITYLNGKEPPKLKDYFIDLKRTLLSAENVKRIAVNKLRNEEATAREEARVAAGNEMAKRAGKIRTLGSLTNNSPGNCKESGSCAIMGGKRKIRKSRKVSKKSRKTRRRK